MRAMEVRRGRPSDQGPGNGVTSKALILLQNPLFLESNRRRFEAFKSVTIPFCLWGVLVFVEGDWMG